MTTIPDAAVEAARRALGERGLDILMDAPVRSALTAAFPHLVAERDAELARLRAVMAIFASDEAWHRDGVCDPNSGSFEGQSIARAALEPKP